MVSPVGVGMMWTHLLSLLFIKTIKMMGHVIWRILYVSTVAAYGACGNRGEMEGEEEACLDDFG